MLRTVPYRLINFVLYSTEYTGTVIIVSIDRGRFFPNPECLDVREAVRLDRARRTDLVDHRDWSHRRVLLLLHARRVRGDVPPVRTKIRDDRDDGSESGAHPER